MATQTTRPMISETSICNQALSWIGGGQIESLEEPSRTAEMCKNNYPFLRDAVLEERMWTFAKVRKSSLVGDLNEDDLYIHAQPLDWLKVFRVYDNSTGSNAHVASNRERPQVYWEKEGRNILTPCANIRMHGIIRITDTGKFTNMFVQTLAARIAAELAMPLTQSTTNRDAMWSLYNMKLDEAAARDGMQGRNEKLRPGSLTTVRRM